jgi:hypothetical protein
VRMEPPRQGRANELAPRKAARPSVQSGKEIRRVEPAFRVAKAEHLAANDDQESEGAPPSAL